MAVLGNKDPGRAYCLANPNDYATGVQWMQRLGWVIETHRKDGVKVLGGPTSSDGDTLTVGGDWVMSIDRKAHEKRQQDGMGVAETRAKSLGQEQAVIEGRRVYGQIEGFDRG